MTDDREPFREAREAGLQRRNAIREERANDKLVDAAYETRRDQIVAALEYEVRQRDEWIERADDETREFWLKVRGRGIPDRPAERDAYSRLAADIREIGSKEASA